MDACNLMYPGGIYCNADPADGSIFHTKKTNRHDSGDHCNDLAFCSCCHGFFLNKAVQILFVTVVY